MNRKISICLFLVVLNVVSIQCQRMVRTLDLVPSLRSRRDYDIAGDYEFDILGEKYTVTSKRIARSVPVTLIGDNGFQLRDSDGEHELYYDENNGAAFTISTRNVNGVVERSLHGTAKKRDGTQLILEPSFDYNKRDDGFDMLTRIVERNISDYYRSFDYIKRDYYYDDEFHYNVTKRASTTNGAVNNYVELAMVADYQYYKNVQTYLKTTDYNKVATFIEAYFVQLASLASQIYERSLANTANLKLKIIPKAIYILTSDSVSDFSSKSANLMKFNGKSSDEIGRPYTDYKKVLKDFTSWSKTNIKNVDYDSAVLITGTNFAEKSSSDVVGYAPEGGICSSDRKSVLAEDYFNFFGYFTIAHELGHNLGLPHDPENNPDDNPECTDDASYLMATSAYGDIFLNNFKLSPCSVKLLVRNIYKNNMFTCLADKEDIADDLKKFIEFYPGQVFPLTDRCKKEFNSNAYPTFQPDVDTDPESETNICNRFKCTYIKDFKVYYYNFKTYERTTCGSGKWCVAGVCTEDSKVPKGDCIVPTDKKFCQDLEDKYGIDNVCDTFGHSSCCEYCNKGYKTISSVSSKTLKEWLDLNPTSSITKL